MHARPRADSTIHAHRHGCPDGGDCNADADAHRDGYTYRDPHAHADCNPDAYEHADADSNLDAYRDAEPDPNPDSHARC